MINIDSLLTYQYRKLLTSDPQYRFRILNSSFKNQFIYYLSNPITITYSFDSLSKYLAIVKSSDNKIKFYSWDDMDPGTWHKINSFAQYKSNSGKVSIQQINNEVSDFTDSYINNVFELFSGSQTLYLTFGWGTHGSGNQHQIVQIFKISGDSLEKCYSCFEDNKDLVIEYPRSTKSNLSFDTIKQQLTYNEFVRDEETGFFSSTGKTIILDFINGVFIKK